MGPWAFPLAYSATKKLPPQKVIKVRRRGLNISALYGIKYMSLDQRGAFGKDNFGVLFLNNLRVKTEYVQPTWTTWFSFETYKFKYHSVNSTDEDQFYSYDLGYSLKNFILAAGMKEIPVFRNENDALEMGKTRLTLLSVGARKDFTLKSSEKTNIKLKGLLSYPFSSSSESSNLSVSSVQGYMITGNVEIERALYHRINYSLYAVLNSSLNFQQVKQKARWHRQSGNLETKILDFSNYFGLLFKF